MRFEFFIATRYLRAKRRQAFIGIITGISIIGVAAGVASLIVALAINNGFRQDLQERLIGSTSHVSLLRIADDGIRDWPPLLERLSKQPHVVAAAPAIFEQVLVSRGPRARGAVLKGMIPADERRVGDLLNSVKQGSAAELEPAPAADHDSVPAQPAGSSDSLADVHARVAAMPPIILGKDMADNLGATVGSVVLVTSPQGELTPFGMVLGYAISYAGGHYHMISLSPEVYSIDYVPFAPRLTDGVLVALVAIGVSFVATLYPSWSAGKTLPAEALRYE